MYRCFLIIFLVVSSLAVVKGQQIDSLGTKSKTDKKLQDKLDSAKANPIVPKIKEKIYHPDSNHSPHKAVMHSLMIPGWGQIYNHQVWKVPVIYAGLGLLAWVYVFNQQNYAINLKVAQDREKGIAPAPSAKEYNLYYQYQQYNISTQAIDDAVTGYKRNEEIGIFSFVGGWGIQMIDAYIDAKFQHTYSMDNNLSLKISPTLMNQQAFTANFNGSYIPGIKLTFALR
jgi:Family of unknown function (DUF5683)